MPVRWIHVIRKYLLYKLANFFFSKKNYQLLAVVSSFSFVKIPWNNARKPTYKASLWNPFLMLPCEFSLSLILFISKTLLRWFISLKSFAYSCKITQLCYAWTHSFIPSISSCYYYYFPEITFFATTKNIVYNNKTFKKKISREGKIFSHSISSQRIPLNTCFMKMCFINKAKLRGVTFIINYTDFWRMKWVGKRIFFQGEKIFKTKA